MALHESDTRTQIAFPADTHQGDVVLGGLLDSLRIGTRLYDISGHADLLESDTDRFGEQSMVVDDQDADRAISVSNHHVLPLSENGTGTQLPPPSNPSRNANPLRQAWPE